MYLKLQNQASDKNTLNPQQQQPKLVEWLPIAVDKHAGNL